MRPPGKVRWRVLGSRHQLKTRECMAIDQSQLTSALNAIVEPELGLPLGTLGLLREVRARRHRVRIELALPVAAWPGSDELADEVHRVARAVPGVEEIEFDLTVMHDDERAALRVALRQIMFGVTTDELDGMTVTGDGWWFNLRPSNTEPLLRLNLEASDETTMTRLRDEVLSIVRAHPREST